jgi:hypothetical protein
VPRQQKVNRLALLIDGAIQIPPFPLDANVGLVHAPATPRRPLATVERFFQLRAVLDDPPVDGGMID